MSARPAALLLAAAALAGCGEADAPIDRACLAPPEAYLDALRAAPGEVRLGEGGGPTIADCASGARSDGDLQEAGTRMVQAADRLALTAQAGDTTAALRLGFLAGAVERGSERTAGIQVELARRVVRAGALIRDPAAERAFLRGLAAGRERG